MKTRIHPALRRLLTVLAAWLAAIGVAPAHAQEGDVPYWASLTVERANMRVGPGGSYRIVWVYQRDGLPVKVVRKLSGWRLVEDPDGTRGWIVARFLSRERAAIVVGEGLADLRAGPGASHDLAWRVEPGVTGLLGECQGAWCRFEIDERFGWIEADRIWGDGNP